jgi:hypothetical protein
MRHDRNPDRQSAVVASEVMAKDLEMECPEDAGSFVLNWK